MNRSLFGLILIGLAMQSSHAQSRWIPYTAHATATFVGVGQPPSISQEMRYRDSAGDLYTAEFAPGSQDFAPGSESPVRSSLYDAVHHIRYTLNLQTRRAVGESVTLAKWRPSPQRVLGHEVLDGMATTVYPIFAGGSEVIGKAWVIDGTDLIVRTCSTMPDGSTYEMKLSNVVLYEEPDQSLFVLPAGFEVVNPADR